MCRLSFRVNSVFFCLSLETGGKIIAIIEITETFGTLYDVFKAFHYVFFVHGGSIPILLGFMAEECFNHWIYQCLEVFHHLFGVVGIICIGVLICAINLIVLIAAIMFLIGVHRVSLFTIKIKKVFHIPLPSTAKSSESYTFCCSLLSHLDVRVTQLHKFDSMHHIRWKNCHSISISDFFVLRSSLFNHRYQLVTR